MLGSGPVHSGGTRVPQRPARGKGTNGQGNQNTGPQVLIRQLAAMPDFTGAPCTQPDVNPETFFPLVAPGPGEGDWKLAEAKSYCDPCPWQADCLAWALETSQGFGVWGGIRLDGMAASTRRELRDRLRRRSA
jgi:WhiB family redox-sensing transcriptional regulator